MVKNYLKDFRKRKGITQKQVALLCDISERQYIRYEVSNQEPTVTVALRIARALDTTVEELFPINVNLSGEDEN